VEELCAKDSRVFVCGGGEECEVVHLLAVRGVGVHCVGLPRTDRRRRRT
jgi:hypothetical protein